MATTNQQNVVDYRKCRCLSGCNDWFSYKLPLDVGDVAAWNNDIGWSMDGDDAGAAQNNGRVSSTMTLGRPRNFKEKNRQVRDACKPPVLGYLATLTRPKSSETTLERRQKSTSDHHHQQQQQQQQHRHHEPVAVVAGETANKSKANLFTKHRITFSPVLLNRASKMKPSSILKTALRRSRSKDCISDLYAAGESYENMWQHKSSVPVYVGWRPPMPLPKDCAAPTASGVAAAAATAAATVNQNNNRINCSAMNNDKNRSRKNVMRKFASESDLLEVESEYSAIDSIAKLPMLPSLPPTLPLLTPLLGRLRLKAAVSVASTVQQEAGTCALNHVSFAHDLGLPHTLPRQKAARSEDGGALPCRKKAECSSKTSSVVAVNGEAPADRLHIKSFVEYSEHLQKRLQLPESTWNVDQVSETTGNRYGPWYDLWPADASVRLCEIAQL